jgi:phosphoglycolate phosphatase-like HAD superfamily hydrolase
MSKAPLITGCREVLAELGRRGLVRAALSNTPEAELREILAAHELTGSLDIIRGGGDWAKSESLVRFLKDFELNAGTCIFLGDGKGDLAAARKAGVAFFGIDPATGEFEGEKDLLGQFENLAEWGLCFLGLTLQRG